MPRLILRSCCLYFVNKLTYQYNILCIKIQIIFNFFLFSVLKEIKKANYVNIFFHFRY